MAASKGHNNELPIPKILWVEDNLTYGTELIESIKRDYQIEILHVLNADDAVLLYHSKPDIKLALLDLCLPHTTLLTRRTIGQIVDPNLSYLQTFTGWLLRDFFADRQIPAIILTDLNEKSLKDTANRLDVPYCHKRELKNPAGLIALIFSILSEKWGLTPVRRKH